MPQANPIQLGSIIVKEPVMPNPKLMRAIYEGLEAHFDEKTKRFALGWSDEKVAAEAGASVQVVQKIRREAFGELAEDPKIAELKDDIQLLRMEADENLKRFSDQLAKLLVRVESLSPRRV